MDESAPTPREAMAREYDTIHNRLFVGQVLLVAGLLAAYQFSGASATLANGLAARFGESRWYVTNAVYTLVTVFGFAACMFPLAYYGEHVLERHYGLSNESFGEWFSDFGRSLLIDLLLAALFFSAIYALLRWSPDWWWLFAALVYILFAVVLSTLMPAVIVPLFHKFEPLEEGELTDAVRKMMEEAGVRVAGVCKWEAGAGAAANAVFAGMGRTRCIVLGDSLLSGFSKEEILAVLAHEAGHCKNRDTLRLSVVSSILALVGFQVAHLCLKGLSGLLGFGHIYDIGTVPLLVFSLFVFSIISMPFANMHSRRREFAADAFAVERMGSSAALVSAFGKLADQDLSNRDPAPWVEFLLHSRPSIARRIERMEGR